MSNRPFDAIRTTNWTFSVIYGPTEDTLEFAIIDHATQDLRVFRGNFGDTVAVMPTERVAALTTDLLTLGDVSVDEAMAVANEALRRYAIEE